MVLPSSNAVFHARKKIKILTITIIIVILTTLFLQASTLQESSIEEAIASFKSSHSKLTCLKNGTQEEQEINVSVNEILAKGQLLYGDSGLKPKSIFPCWMNLELARIGQRFARRNLAQTSLGHFYALIMIVMNPQLRRALHSTGKSDLPIKALERYGATGMQVQLWYQEDILSPNWLLSVTTVRAIHDSAGKNFKKKNLTETFSKPQKYFEKGNDALPLESKVNEFMWKAFSLDLENVRKKIATQREKIISKNFDSGNSGSHSGFGNTSYLINHEPKHLFNQYLMSITQWAFVSLPIIKPTKVGIVKWTDLELKGFAHLWAIISFVLGMDEQFIICRDTSDLSGCRKYLEDMLHVHLVPNMYDIDLEGKVMVEALLKMTSFAAPGVPMDIFLIKILEDIVEIPAPNMNRRSDWRTRLGRYVSKNWIVPLNHSPLVNRIFSATAVLASRWSSLLAFGNTGTNYTRVAKEFYFY